MDSSNTRESMETVPKILSDSCGSPKVSPGSEDSYEEALPHKCKALSLHLQHSHTKTDTHRIKAGQPTKLQIPFVLPLHTHKLAWGLQTKGVLQLEGPGMPVLQGNHALVVE